ncbi:MAG: 2-polyprenylphenol 6-hydroxylase, partial [Gammaproteobacteria bacterium]
PSPLLHRAIYLLTLISRRSGDTNKSPGQRLAQALESLGPSFIKLGQILATRPDLVGEDVSNDLTLLQDRLPAFPSDQARQIIEEELEAPLEKLFSEFTTDAVAAASIAQVHKATTHDGQEVAVKILRPNIEEAFARDIATFRWVAEILEKRVPGLRRLRPVDVVDAFADMVRQEMNLQNEAAAGSELRENTTNDPGFRVPFIVWNRTSNRVLTTEWIDGIPINKRAELVAAGHDMATLGTGVVRNLLVQVMRDGFFHADLHQGNLFVDPDGNIVAVDFGIMGRLDKRSRRYLAGIMRGFHTGDYRRIAEIHFEAGYVPRHKDIGEFAQALRAIGEPVAGTPLQELSFGRMLAQLFEVTESFEMQTQPHLLLLQKSMAMVEGLSVQLNPDINMWDVSPPIIRDWMEANMGPTALLQEGIESAIRLFRYLPLIADEAEEQVKSLTRDGIHLHPDTTKMLANQQGPWQRAQTIILGIIATLFAIWLFSDLI